MYIVDRIPTMRRLLGSASSSLSAHHGMSSTMISPIASLPMTFSSSSSLLSSFPSRTLMTFPSSSSSSSLCSCSVAVESSPFHHRVCQCVGCVSLRSSFTSRSFSSIPKSIKSSPSDIPSSSSPSASASPSDNQTANTNSVSEFDLDEEIVNSLKTNFGITEFYPIQSRVMGPVLEGRDVIAKSRTGTGKTLAFVVPLVQRLVTEGHRPRRNRCQIIVMEPTRELAKQVAAEIEKLTDRFSVGTAYGGASYTEQVKMLNQGVDFLIATPGRLLDFLEKGSLKLDDTKVVVLDESDEMLRRGFQEDIEKIFGAAKDRTQTMLFSATVPPW